MKLFGLIGFPVQHSFSKNYFEKKFQELQLKDHEFRLFPLEDIAAFPKLIHEHPELSGLAVTIPHKVAIIPFLEHLDAASIQVGAVNCIRIKKGKCYGYNTDIIGFENSIIPHLHKTNQRALILGTGGAAKAVSYVFQKLNMPYELVSRMISGDGATFTYESLTQEIMDAHRLIVNCTPLGTSPEVNQKPPIPYQYLTNEHLLFDLVYNPAVTAFMKSGLEQGARVVNGMEMLEIQAENNWRIWNED
jgi:shikimate dehydrogenase